MNRSLKIPLVDLAHARLAQKEVLGLESAVPGSILTGGNILSLEFLVFAQ